MKRITGKYEIDDNFTTICSGGIIYTISRGTHEIGSIKIGEQILTGHILTAEDYNRIEGGYSKTGTFNLDI